MYVSSVKFKDIIKVVPSYSPSIVLAYSESGAENPDVFRLFFHCLTAFSLKTNRPSVPVRNGHGRTLRPVRDPLKSCMQGKSQHENMSFRNLYSSSDTFSNIYLVIIIRNLFALVNAIFVTSYFLQIKVTYFFCRFAACGFRHHSESFQVVFRNDAHVPALFSVYETYSFDEFLFAFAFGKFAHYLELVPVAVHV